MLIVRKKREHDLLLDLLKSNKKKVAKLGVRSIVRKHESSRVQNPMPIFAIGFLRFLPLKCEFCTEWQQITVSVTESSKFISNPVVSEGSKR